MSDTVCDMMSIAGVFDQQRCFIKQLSRHHYASFRSCMSCMCALKTAAQSSLLCEFQELHVCFKDTGHYLVIVKDQSSHLMYLNIFTKWVNLWKFELNWSSKLRDNNERKTTLFTRSCVLSDAWFRDLKI